MPSPLTRSTLVATVLQLAMVVTGHFSLRIASLFALGGTGISAVGGLLLAIWTGGKPAPAFTTKGGAIAGGLSALIGIAVSCALGDVDAGTLVYGTIASVGAGILGAFVGRALNSGSTAA